MDYESNNKDSKTGVPSSEKDASNSSNKHKYRLLGESGLVEDEEGNIYDASDIDDSDREDWMSNEVITATLFPSKPAKDQMPDWAAIYDPRYCGPSREAYIEEMTREYRRKHPHTLQTDSSQREKNEGHHSGTVDDWLKHNNISTESDGETTGDVDAAKNSSSAPIGVVFGKGSPIHSESAEESSEEEKPGAVQNPDLESKKKKHDPNNWFGLHLRTRDVVFYAIGAIALIAYFIFLIYVLISKVVDLF